MKPSSGVKRGIEFLKGTTTSEMEYRLKAEHSGKSRERLQAALLRRQGQDLESIRKILGRGKGSISRWLNRMQKEGPDAILDGKSTGRPCKLSKVQQEAVKISLAQDPMSSGFERSNWTARLLGVHIENNYDIRYSASGALALAYGMGYSIRVPRSVPYNTPDKETIDKYVSNTIQAITSHASADYAIYCLDAAGFVDSPFSARGIRPIGGHETVKSNFKTATTKAIGALGQDGLVLDFYDDVGSDSVIDLLEQIRKKHGRVFVICDNASGHKSKKIKEYLEKACGDVVLWYLPPYTPQHNPIEMMWREIKRAIAGRYFGSFEKMHDTIKQLIKSGEVATVKLFKYMLDAIDQAKNVLQTSVI